MSDSDNEVRAYELMASPPEWRSDYLDAPQNVDLLVKFSDDTTHVAHWTHDIEYWVDSDGCDFGPGRYRPEKWQSVNAETRRTVEGQSTPRAGFADPSPADHALVKALEDARLYVNIHATKHGSVRNLLTRIDAALAAARRVDSIVDQANGVVTYELSDGRMIKLDAHLVREYGAASILRDRGLGHLLPTERLPVFFHGREIGTMSPYFDPANIKSQSFLYDPRPGDFTRVGDKWIAANNLGIGDIEAVIGFTALKSTEAQRGR